MSLFQEPFFWLLAPPFVFVAVFKLIERFDSGWADGFSVLGIVSAVFALLLWATPSYCNYYFPLDISCDRFFEAERLPAVAAFLALAFILLLLRRR